jgi:Ni/Fe-hydrogenase subunit HybB-like protein
MCVMVYLTVLYIEFLPIVTERFRGKVALPGPMQSLNGLFEGFLRFADNTFNRVMFIFIIMGVVLSCLHQSSLGGLMVIAKYKMHPLWWTPILPLLFLLSALSVGYPMVVFESIIASKVFNRKPEMHILAPLGKIIPVFLFVYIAFKLGDLSLRGQLGAIFAGTAQSNMFLAEFALGVLLPFFMLLTSRVRHSAPLLFTAATLVILGVVMNRINVFLTAYTPVYKQEQYFPSIGEIMVTVGLVSALMFVYRVMVTIFPILPAEEEAR